jgi:predicted PurR-regulated permease PerM
MQYYINTIVDVLKAYGRGQGLVILVLSVLYAVALGIVGIPFGIAIGIAAGLLSIVPYLGFIVGFVLAVISAIVQSVMAISPDVGWSLGSFSQVYWVVLAFAVVQLLESFVITPRIMGKSMGIGFVPSIVLLILAGAAFGPIGMIIVIPIAAIIIKVYKDKRKS